MAGYRFLPSTSNPVRKGNGSMSYDPERQARKIIADSLRTDSDTAGESASIVFDAAANDGQIVGNMPESALVACVAAFLEDYHS